VKERSGIVYFRLGIWRLRGLPRAVERSIERKRVILIYFWNVRTRKDGEKNV